MIFWFLLLISILLFSGILIWTSTFHPKEVQAAPYLSADTAPELQPSQSLKILSYNVQYMAGKNYVFFYDIPGSQGPDSRPSREDISNTFREVARVIRAENPDIILLQEVNDGAKRTDYEDQLTRLLEMLPDEYACYASTFYWKARFVPHPNVMGPAGMKLVTISKYRITKATRFRLPQLPRNVLSRQFLFKRAVLAVELPVAGQQPLVLLNTHLDTWAKGCNTMQQQIIRVDEILAEYQNKGHSWIIGGDFNLLPPGIQFQWLSELQKTEYRAETEIQYLFDKYPSIPSLEDVNGPNSREWLTHFPNDPKFDRPQITLDYFFYDPNLKLIKSYVRQADTWHISDHLPLIGEFQLFNTTESCEKPSEYNPGFPDKAG